MELTTIRAMVNQMREEMQFAEDEIQKLERQNKRLRLENEIIRCNLNPADFLWMSVFA